MALLGLGFLGAYVYREARGPSYDAGGIPLERYTLQSQLARRSLTELAIVPPGGGKRNLLVLLHGRGSGPAGLLSTQLFRELGRLGRRAPVVVLLNGGDASYFHDRADGAWGSYVLVEAIPDAIRRFGTTSRVAVGGVTLALHDLPVLDPIFAALAAPLGERPLPVRYWSIDDQGTLTPSAPGRVTVREPPAGPDGG